MKKILILIVLFCSLQAVKAQFGADTLVPRLDTCLIKANRYFSLKDIYTKRSDVIMILCILNKRFELPLKVPSDKYFAQIHNELNQTYFRLYGISFNGKDKAADRDSAAVMKEFYNHYSNLDYRTLWSMYSHLYPMPDSIIDYIHREMGKGSYDMTHAALQFCCLWQNGYRNTKLSGYLAEAKYQLEQTLRYRGVWDGDTDIRLEAMALLCYMGEYDRIRIQDLKFLLNTQEPNGGWKSADSEEVSNEHSTILGLWSILEVREHISDILSNLQQIELQKNDNKF